MIGQRSVLVTLVEPVDRLPTPPPDAKKRGPGRPRAYSDRLFLTALVVMIVRHLHTVAELLSVLAHQGACQHRSVRARSHFRLPTGLVLYQYEHNRDLRVGLKAFLKAA